MAYQRSKIVLKSLDDARYSALTPPAKRQIKTRATGENSSRDKPDGSRWIFTV